jgi:3-hydroxyacyl-[acyl-carrier-protein] dehydratase
MLLLDEIREFDDKSGTGVRHVRGDEFWCAGHFPSKPIMPGVLQVEALAQTAGFIVFENLRKTDAIPKLAYFTTMEKIRFSNMVHPGDTLELRVELIGRKMKLYKFRGVATVAGKKVCEAVFSAIMDDDVGAE